MTTATVTPTLTTPEPNRFCLGLDLGKQTDPSAQAVLQWHVPPPPPPMVPIGYRIAPPPMRRPVYEVPTLARWPLGTPYTKITQAVAAFLKKPPLCDHAPLLVVDATGVGDAVYEMLWASLLEADLHAGGICGVTITAGGAVSQVPNVPGRWRVAKKQLASVLQVLLGHRRLRIAKALPEAKTLKDELGKFSVKITEALNETYEAWRENDHDDLVLAVALAAWAAEYLDYFKPPIRLPA